ncbi:ABC transporter [Erythrobacter alti]|uniref:ABC transporter n=1 Tax=Erythrobacter alti TaxID=1896145 RepID=UPI0030F3EA11
MLRSSKAICAGLLLALSGMPALAQDDPAAQDRDGEPVIALMGTIPIYWGEAAGFDELLSGTAPAHWAREVLERRAELAPLDYLSEDALAPHRYLLLAQPRGLSGEENVALDSWVREGGRLLLFADPWMTGESRFHIGDRRRPQDVALLSPILTHWGLDLEEYNHALGGGLHNIDHDGQMLPIDSSGTFRLLAGDGGCQLELSGLLADCRIDQGQVLIMADAAILDAAGPYPHAESGLESLLARIFPQMRENTGIHAESPEVTGGNDGNPPEFVSEAAHWHGANGENPPQ